MHVFIVTERGKIWAVFLDRENAESYKHAQASLNGIKVYIEQVEVFDA